MYFGIWLKKLKITVLHLVTQYKMRGYVAWMRWEKYAGRPRRAQGRHVIATRLIDYEYSVMLIIIQDIRRDSTVKILSQWWNYQIHTTGIKASTKFGSAIAQEVSRWIPTAAARLPAGIKSCWICGGTKWRWGRFSPRTSVSPANLYSTKFFTLTITAGAGTIGQKWPTCRVDPVSTQPPTMRIKY
jgi:hypothetical protein